MHAFKRISTLFAYSSLPAQTSFRKLPNSPKQLTLDLLVIHETEMTRQKVTEINLHLELSEKSKQRRHMGILLEGIIIIITHNVFTVYFATLSSHNTGKGHMGSMNKSSPGKELKN